MKINNGEELLEKFAKKLVLDRGRVFEVNEKAVEVERILDEVIFIKNGEIVEYSNAEKLREQENASIDEIFRRRFKNVK